MTVKMKRTGRRQKRGRNNLRRDRQCWTFRCVIMALESLCEDGYGEQPSESDIRISLLESSQEHSFESDSRLHSPGKIVNELFKEAKEHGAVTAEEANKLAEALFKVKSFTGGGYKLGDSSLSESEYIRGDELFPGGSDVQILLKLWSNGFSLDDGELRTYADPVNAQFLESIKRGEIPIELQRMVHEGQVSIDMEDHQDQEYVKPRLKFKAFSGEGKKLGSLTPEIISTPSSPEEEHKSFLNADVELDEHVPTTKIQIRLSDGSRLIQRFNLSHRRTSSQLQFTTNMLESSIYYGLPYTTLHSQLENWDKFGQTVIHHNHPNFPLAYLFLKVPHNFCVIFFLSGLQKSGCLKKIWTVYELCMPSTILRPSKALTLLFVMICFCLDVALTVSDPAYKGLSAHHLIWILITCV
ncbi:UBX domain-containing protein 2B isoform X2 [Mixophyes fleayi]|uniref:UBX domain-containing protein 2B isoform X2 n=1 Tax=Mixophyes fleayi TaxID=3061075 RepID=UPI003F4D86D8